MAKRTQGRKRNKQTEAAQRARNIEREAERLARKDGKKKRTAKEVAVIVVSVIFVISVLLPSFSLIFAQQSDSSSSSFPTSFEDAAERYQGDVEDYREAAERNPEDKQAQLDLGNALYQWGIYADNYASDDAQRQQATDLLDEAQSAFTRYLELEGSLDSTEAKTAATYRALSCYYAGDTEKAEELLEELGNEANYAPAWANLGMMYEQEGDTTRALEAYQKGVDADPDGSAGSKDYCEQQISSLRAQSAESSGGAAGLAGQLDGTSADTSADQG